MKLIIDIPEDRYDKNYLLVKSGMGDDVHRAVANGTPIPDNATLKYAEQEPKTGKWQYVPEDEGWYICSECRCGNDYADNFCPNCGAKMESEE